MSSVSDKFVIRKVPKQIDMETDGFRNRQDSETDRFAI
jgi:hypothetical protein